MKTLVVLVILFWTTTCSAGMLSLIREVVDKVMLKTNIEIIGDVVEDALDDVVDPVVFTASAEECLNASTECIEIAGGEMCTTRCGMTLFLGVMWICINPSCGENEECYIETCIYDYDDVELYCDIENL